MAYHKSDVASDQINLQRLPSFPKWITPSSGKTPENTAFLAGAAFAMLDFIWRQGDEAIPKNLIANTLALKAAVATSRIEGRLALKQEIRDAYHLTPPGEDGTCHWGPDGEVLDFWHQGVRLRLSSKDWQDKASALSGPRLKDVLGDVIAKGLERAQQSGPMAATVLIIRDVLNIDERAERVACLLSDVILAKSFGWDHLLPLTALHLTKASLRELKSRTVEQEASIHASITKGAQTAFRLANSLTLRADALRAVAPKLRARGSAEAVALFLTEEAVAPSGMLSPYIRGTRTPMTGRAARRLCDRLVELGVVKELTGRATFRLYGVVP